MKTEQRILVAVAAATDAIWLPCREPNSTFWQVVHERRRSYPEIGVDWKTRFIQPGANPSECIAIDRRRDKLIADGFLETFQQKGSKTLSVRLTDKGEIRARDDAGLPFYCDVWEALYRVWDFRNCPDGFDQDGLAWVREIDMNGGRGWEDEKHHKELVVVEILLLGFMSRGMVVSNCDKGRRVWYAVTRAGVEAERLQSNRKRPAVSDEAHHFYYDRLNSSLATLRVARPICPADLGAICLSCSPPLRRFDDRFADSNRIGRDIGPISAPVDPRSDRKQPAAV